MNNKCKNENKPCSLVAPLLSPYQDNELDEQTRRVVSAHLETCGQCRAELQLLELLQQKMKALPELEASLNFTPRVMGAVKEKQSARWFAVPSLVYSFIFIIVFVLGFLLAVTINLKEKQQVGKEEMVIANLLAESQDLSLINIQEQTFALLYNGNGDTARESEPK